jgi:predicted nucleic acid-binding protein
MARRERKYALDINLFIESFRRPKAKEAIQRFHRAFGPFEFLCAVVAHELRAGVTTPQALRDLERYVLRPFAKRRRVFAPSVAAWERAGDVLASLRAAEGVDLKRMRRAFGNDVLLAVACREAGVTLVTNNVQDFERIGQHMDFDWVRPWPGPRK